MESAMNRTSATDDGKVNILFVDDEAMLLQGLRRMLHPMRAEWNMTFVNSAAAALDHLSGAPVDVVVSDMRMPGMDGAELLSRVSEIQPAAIRIVLSGFAENEAVLRTLGPSHQYLAKPCDADHLIKTIQRSQNLRHHLTDTRLETFIAGMGSLPVLPQTYHDFMAAIADPKASTGSIAAVIERDIGLTATVLKLTNSAYFSLPANILDCGQAVRLLGLDTIRSMVASACVFRCYEGVPSVQARLEALRDCSLATAAAARRIAMEAKLPDHEVEQACCAGLLAHVGTLVLLAEHPDCSRETEDLIRRENLDSLDAERRIVGANHAEAGAYLLSLWGFSDPIVEAVLHHHDQHMGDQPVTDVMSAVQAAQATSKNCDECTLPAGSGQSPDANLSMKGAVS
jgi:HD-like signal output (HDOD) protein